MEILKHHMDRYVELAKQDASAEDIARSEVEKDRHPRYGNWYRLDSESRIDNAIKAIVMVIEAIRNGRAVEVPDYNTYPDVMCRNCAAICWKKHDTPNGPTDVG